MADAQDAIQILCAHATVDACFFARYLPKRPYVRSELVVPLHSSGSFIRNRPLQAPSHPRFIYYIGVNARLRMPGHVPVSLDENVRR